MGRLFLPLRRLRRKARRPQPPILTNKKEGELINTIHLTLRISPDENAALTALAAQKNCTRSELIRQFLKQGLSLEGTKDSIDFIRENIHDEIELICQPQFERLAKLIAKIGYQSVADFNLLCYIIDGILPKELQVEFEEMKRRSKMMAIAYLKLRDTEFAEFLLSEDRALDLLGLQEES